MFANLAGLAGPVPGKPDSMMAVNYRAPVAAARACEALGFGHFVQSSTLGDKGGESRAGAVFEVEIYDGLFACEIGEVTGVDYEFRTVIQFEEWCSSQRGDMLNMTDLALLPLTRLWAANGAVAAAGGGGCSE